MKEDIANSGACGLAAIMLAVAFWGGFPNERQSVFNSSLLSVIGDAAVLAFLI